MAEYNLIAIDMDGTLLNSQHQISPRTRLAVTESLCAGKQVVFATGRCLGEMKEYLEEFPGMRYLICENGACIRDLFDDRDLYREPIAKELTERVIRAVEQEDVLVSFFIGNRAFMNADSIRRLAEYGLDSYVEVLEKTMVRVPDLFSFYRDNPLEAEKITLYFRDQQTRARVKNRLASMQLQLASSIAGNLEISAAKVSKGRALQKLCEILQLPSEKTVAVGDGNNDREMLKYAGVGVAMKNAVPELIREAKKMTEDCDHDGAALVMEEYLL